MPESDSDNFESADEDVSEEKTVKEKATKSQEISTSNPVNNSSSWKSWGAFEMISSASKSVAKATTKMTQSLSTAIDAINIPAPEEIAKMHAEQKKSNDEDSPVSENKNTEQYVGEESSVFKLDSLLSNVGLVVSGGLDTLEGIGKKTMNILQETDPGLKDKIRGINSNRPNLSEILKEAKNSDTPNELEIKPLPLVSFEHLLEEYYGMVYLEALEVLAKQSKMKIELLLKPLTGKSLMEVEETLKEVQELCEIPDSEVVNDKITTVSLNEHLSKAVEDLNITLNFKDIVSYCLELNKFFEELEEHDSDSMTLYNKSIEALAKLCSLSLKNYQKMAELMLSLTHRSTADEVDSVTQLTSVYFSLFNFIATTFSEKIGKLRQSGSNKNLSMEVFIECSNAISFIKKAFDAFIPILQIGAL